MILPITDPYVVHHGALGSFITVYLPTMSTNPALIKRIAASGDGTGRRSQDKCALRIAGRPTGRCDLPSRPNFAIGTSVSKHDLSGLTLPLRSHGGMTEQQVPVIFNRKLKALPSGYRLRNFSAFDLALNYAVVAPATMSRKQFEEGAVMGVVKKEKMRLAGNFGTGDRSFEVSIRSPTRVIGTCP